MGPVDHLVLMEVLDQEDQRVLKENQAHLDQGTKDFQERRGMQDVLALKDQRGIQETWEPLVLQESVAPVALKGYLDPREAEVLREFLVKRVAMVHLG